MAQDSTNGARRVHCPEEVLASIPWYADGDLSARERGAVEAHAALCRDCRAELDIVSGRPWAMEGVALPDADRMFREIGARIEAEQAGEANNVIPISRGRALSPEDLARIESWVLDPESEFELESELASDADAVRNEASREVAAPRAGAGAVPVERETFSRLRRSRMQPTWLSAAAALALFFAGGLAGGLAGGSSGGLFGRNPSAAADRSGGASLASAAAGAESADYQLASAAPAAGAQDAGPKLDVVFADSATARAISETLRELGVEIVAGPSNLGVYRLRVLPAAVESGEPGAADAAAVAARLAAGDGAVAIFAEPVP